MSGMVYYRLGMVDYDGKNKRSEVKAVRIGTNGFEKVTVYPNPIVNNVHITIPRLWQDKEVSYYMSKVNGQKVSAFTVPAASQTETLNMSNIPPGVYILRISQGSETAVKTLIKAKN